MEIYFFSFFLLVVFSCLEVAANNRRQFIFLYSILFVFFVLQYGLRWETGTDWIPYLESFKASSFDSFGVQRLDAFEIGYTLLSSTVRLVTDNYSIFLLVHSIIYFLFLFAASKELTPFPIVSLLFSYAFLYGLLGSNRQLIALVICLFSLRYVVSRQPVRFFGFVFLASLFHSSAVVFFIAFILKDVKLRWMFFLLLFSLFFGLSSYQLQLFSSFAGAFGEGASYKVSTYLDNGLGDFSLTGIGVVRRFFLLSVFTVFYSRLARELPYYRICFNLYVLSIVFYVLFAGSLQILVNRGSLYFNVMECFLLADLFALFGKKKAVWFILLSSFYAVWMFFASFQYYFTLFLPYKGLFLNSSFDRIMY